MTDREAFEAWRQARSSALRNPTDWEAWKAATAAERERCAKVCGVLWGQHAGSTAYGCGLCAAAIRKGGTP